MTDLKGKPNIVRVERDAMAVGGGRFYKVMYDRPVHNEYVTIKDGDAYTYIIATDELHAWGLVQTTLDIQYGKD